MDSDKQDSQYQSRTYTAAGLAAGQIWADSAERLPKGLVLDGKFEIIDELGRGGMGVVYRVNHLLLNKVMALKTFNTQSVDQTAGLRFVREARSIARLQHTNIVQINDFGTWGEHATPYYAMELLAGESLAELIERAGTLSIKQATEIFIDVARALDYASGLGIIHRDIKPANIFLAGNDTQFTVKLVDFGIAKLVDSAVADSHQLTSTGLIFGSPLYMPPEQVTGGSVTAQSDIYSTGCALYQALTGATPFRGANALVTMQMHVAATPPPLPERLLETSQGQKLNTVIGHMLAKDKAERYQSGAELAQDLKNVMALEQTNEKSNQVSSVKTRQSISNRAGADNTVNRDLTDKATGTIRRAPLVALLAVALFIACSALFVLFNPFNQNTLVKTPDSTATDVAPARPSTSATTSLQSSGAEPVHYYSTINSDGSRTFRFPSKVSLGTLESPGSFWTSREARGTVHTDSHLLLYLKGSDDILSNPQLLDGLRPDDLTKLEIGNFLHELDSGVLPHLTRLTNLKALTIADSEITPEIIEAINKFPGLERLELQHSHVAVTDLIHVERLTKFSGMAFEDLRGASSIIARLKRAPNKVLKDLDLTKCRLDDNDLEQLSQIDTITTLKLPLNNFGERGLKALQRMPKLEILSILGCDASPACLKNFQKLKSLTLTRKFYNDATLADIRKTLSYCDVKTDQ